MTYRFTNFMILFFLYVEVVAQQQPVVVQQIYLDSLQSIVDGTALDSIRLKASKTYVYAISQSENKGTIRYADKGKALAKKLQRKHDELQFDYLKVVFYYHNWSIDTALVISRCVRNEAIRTEDAVMLQKINRLLGDIFYRDNQYDSAMSYYRKGMPDDGAMKEGAQQAFTMMAIADTYADQSKFEQAVLRFQQAAEMFKKLDSQKHPIDYLKHPVKYQRISEGYQWFQISCMKNIAKLFFLKMTIKNQLQNGARC